MALEFQKISMNEYSIRFLQRNRSEKEPGWGFILLQVLLKNTMAERSVFLYDSLIVPPMRLLERVVPPPVGKNLLLVAEKA